MKRNYFFIAFAALAITANAQVNDIIEINDDMESYNNGPLFEGHWSTWHGEDSGENIEITSAESASGERSGVVNPGPLGPQDVLLLLGNQTEGLWNLSWNFLIPEGMSGYFNIQGQTDGIAATNPTVGIFNSGDINFADSGIVVDLNGNQSLPFPQGEWFPMNILFNLTGTAPTYTITVNGLPMQEIPFRASGDQTLGAIDFFASLETHTNFIDDVVFAAGALSTDDFNNENFHVFPNPVVNNLNIESVEAINNVTVYDVLGKAVLTASPGVASPSIDMSSLTTGVYLVNIATENSSKTIKVLK